MMYCTKCGKQNEDNARFCAFCGAPLKQGGNTENTEQADGQGNVRGTKEKKNRSKAGKILLILLPVLVVLAAAAVTVIVFIIPGQREKKYQAQIAEGNRYLEELDYEKAEASYMSAIDVEPKKEEPYLRLAEIYNVQDEPEKAVEILLQGVKATEGSEVRRKYELYSYADKVLAGELGRCEDGEYTAKYVRTEYYVSPEPVHDLEGVLTSRIRDFDNDGDEELMVIVMTNEKGLETPYAETEKNIVYVRMYESSNGEIVLQDEFMALYPVMGSGDMENSGIFLQEHDGDIYICGTTYSLTYLTADGSVFNSFVLLYTGEGFEKKAGTEGIIGGSEFSGEEQNAYEMADYLETIGLVNEAAQIRETWMRRFDFSDPSEEMILRITGENDGGADLFSFSATMDPESLGTIIYHIQTSWDDEISEDAAPEDTAAAESSTEDEPELSSDVYRREYGPLLDQTLEKYENDMGKYLLYYVYDIDKNGVRELIVQTGTCEADYMYEIYTIQDGKAVYLGEIAGGHTSFFADEKGGAEDYIIQMYAQMGYERICHVSLQNGVPVSEEISSREVPADEEYYSNEYPLEYAYITDKSLLENS